MIRILISDDLSPEAKTILERIPDAQVDFKPGIKPQELREIISGYEALAVRSATKVTAEVLAAAPKLRVIGRAGTGVDNIDLPAATRRGAVGWCETSPAMAISMASGAAFSPCSASCPAKEPSFSERRRNGPIRSRTSPLTLGTLTAFLTVPVVR